MPDYRFPKMVETEEGLSVSFDVTTMVHDLARQVVRRVEEGAVAEVVAFLAVNGHLADLIRKAKAQAWHEGFCRGEVSGEREWPLNPHTENPYTEES